MPTISVDLSGGPHGSITLHDIPLIDGEPPAQIEYRDVVYRLLAAVPGRRRRLYQMHTVTVRAPDKPAPAATPKTPAKKATPRARTRAKNEPTFTG